MMLVVTSELGMAMFIATETAPVADIHGPCPY